MRLNWILDQSDSASIDSIWNACKAFHMKYNYVPDTVKLTYDDYARFIGSLYQQSLKTLEKGKKYGLFVMVPGGMVEIQLLDSHDESVAHNMHGQTIMIVESSELDREFEKHILNKGK